MLHLVVDGLCSYLIFAKLYPDNTELSLFIFLGYNLLAFVTQAPVGAIIDKYNKPKLFLVISCICVSLGYILSGVAIISVILIGMGNSLFHVCGGKYITEESDNDISALGIFVSTGAIGLFIGQKYTSFLPLVFIFFSVLLIGTVLLFLSNDGKRTENREVSVEIKNSFAIFIAVIAVVVIRSFIGKIATGEFEITGIVPLLIALATALGKACGGIVSKIIGINKTAIISFTVAAVCLTLGRGVTVIYIIGVFAFNFSMPITLYFANQLLNGKEGFAFGSLAAFLIPGYFIAMSIPKEAAIYTVIPLVIMSLALILITGCAFNTWKGQENTK